MTRAERWFEATRRSSRIGNKAHFKHRRCDCEWCYYGRVRKDIDSRREFEKIKKEYM